jgi:hypothetical protein
VVLTLGSVLLGLVIGLSLRPRSTRFARPRVHKAALLAAGLAGQLLAGQLNGNGAVVLAIASLVALVAFGVANLHLTGMGVMTIGLGLNLFALMVNGGMPVSTRALVAADIVPAADVASVQLSGPRHVERSNDAIKVIGDIIPLGHQVVSFGDLIIAVATVDVVAHLVRRQRRRQVAMSSTSPDHDWGTAPSPVPSSPSQYSENPDSDAPRTLVSATSAPESHNR